MSTVRIMSANLFNGRTQPDALATTLREVKPDVVACQELSENAAEVLHSLLPHGRLEPRDDYHGGGIVAARPVEVEPVPLKARHGWTTRLIGDAWSAAPDLTVTSVHFTNPIVRPVRNSLAERRGQLSDALTHIDAVDGPIVIVGDFNSTPIWPAYRRLRETIADGVVDIGAHRRTWGPWWWFPRLLRIDHAFVRGVALSSASQVRIRGMDHSALVVDATID